MGKQAEQGAHSDDAPADASSQGDVMQAAQELQTKGMMYLTGAMTVSLIGLGDELGLYKALKANDGPVTSAELAKATGTHERWVREWLYQQAAAGFVTADAEAHRFHLSPAQQLVLTNEYGSDASPLFSAGFIRTASLAIKTAPIKDGFVLGRGWNYDAIADQTGGESVCGMCRVGGPWIRHFLVQRISAQMPALHDKLLAGIMVADVGCGTGEALMTLAEAYPNCTFHGYDIAQRQQEKGLGYLNLSWLNPGVSGGGLPDVPTYDLMLTFDAVHDMARPDQVLPVIRKAIKADGGWLVFDMRGGPTPADNLSDPQLQAQAPVLYGFSVHVCLPSGLSEEGGLGLGTLGWSEKVARQMTADAGFTQFQVMSFEHQFNDVFWIQP